MRLEYRTIETTSISYSECMKKQSHYWIFANAQFHESELNDRLFIVMFGVNNRTCTAVDVNPGASND